MDDGITLLPKDVDPSFFLELLNSMNPAIRFTVGEPRIFNKGTQSFQMLCFLSIMIYLSESGIVSTDVHYKETNSHDYLNFMSHHPPHIKKNIPFVLAKRIIVMTSDDVRVEENLCDLKKYLLHCDYTIEVINKGIHNAKLQGPAPKKENGKVIPLISTYYSNYENSNVIQIAKNLINNSKDERIKSTFKEVNLIHAYKQPPNLLSLLSNSAFINKHSDTQKCGIFKCSDKRCKICALYIQSCKSFITANGTNWEVRCYIDCNSRNVVYYLVCCFCKKTSYTGKTDHLRPRTNNHITGCRLGNSTDKFDNHVFKCAQSMKLPLIEPFFKMYAFMSLNDYNKLRNYERKLHAEGHDTMNK